MNIQEQIAQVKALQDFTGGYTDLALENIQNAPFLFIAHLKEVEITLGDTMITVELIPDKSVKGWFYRTFQKKLILKNLNLLGRYILFWVPKTQIMPKVSFSWKK